VTWWVIVNPLAGRPEEATGEVEQALSQLPIEFRIQESTSPDHVAEIIRLGHEAGIRRFAGVGGGGGPPPQATEKIEEGKVWYPGPARAHAARGLGE